MKGHIKITDKVYFVYYELPKPIVSLYSWNGFFYAKREYKASKKKVEVSNEYAKGTTHPDRCFIYVGKMRKMIHNQPCEAEVTDTALITKIL